MRDVLRAAGVVAEAERRQHAPFRNVQAIALLIFARQRGRDLGRQPVQAEWHKSQEINFGQNPLQFELTGQCEGSLDGCRCDYPSCDPGRWPEPREHMAQQSKTQFGYCRHADQDRSGGNLAEYPVVVVGAGPVGLSLAIDLAQRGQPVVLLDDADRIGEGSRAICFSKRSLEYWDRLGAGQRMVDKGVVWSVGRIFHGDSQLYQFNLLPEQGHKRPAFINLQQFYAEAYLVDRVEELSAIDLRWRNKVVGLEQRNDHVALTVATPDGPYQMHADFVVAC